MEHTGWGASNPEEPHPATAVDQLSLPRQGCRARRRIAKPARWAGSIHLRRSYSDQWVNDNLAKTEALADHVRRLLGTNLVTLSTRLTSASRRRLGVLDMDSSVSPTYGDQEG